MRQARFISLCTWGIGAIVVACVVLLDCLHLADELVQVGGRWNVYLVEDTLERINKIAFIVAPLFSIVSDSQEGCNFLEVITANIC